MREEPAAEPADHAAQAVIARQAAEIAHLRQLLAEEHLAADLREALGLTAVAAVLARPIGEQRLLEMILGTAMQAIAAHAGALFLVDEERGDLIFRVALGGQAVEVRDLRVPLGHGVAGLVAVSGQPMIVSNAEEDARQASDIAARVHYQPRTMLCVPLLFDDRVIGVLELLDKVEASSFTMDDMAMLSRFAEQAAVAIEQAHVQYNLTRMLQALI